MTVRLKQLAADGATTNQILKRTSSEWAPADLIDTVSATDRINDFFTTDETSPAESTMSGVPVLDFAVDEEVQSTTTMPDGWDGSSDLDFRILYGMSSAESGKTVRITTEGYIVDASGNIVATISAANYDLSPGSSANAPERSPVIRSIGAGNLGVGDQVVLKIARRTAPSNEHGGDLRLVEATATLDISAGNSVSIPLPYAEIIDLTLSHASLSTVQIGTGRCRSDDATVDMVVASPITVDITASGANGLDTGSEAATTWYYVWLIKNLVTGTVAGLLSTSDTSPTMPSGYTKKRRIGSVRNDDAIGSGSSDFLRFYQTGTSKDRRYIYLEGLAKVRALSSGSATTDTNVDCSSYVPVTAEVGYFHVTAAVQNGRMKPGTGLWDNTYGSTMLRYMIGENYMFCPVDSSQRVQYANDGGGGSTNIEVMGYFEHL